MLDYLGRKDIMHDAFFKKYAAKKYMKASIIVREWIRTEYTEDETMATMTETRSEEVEYGEPEQENTPEDDHLEKEDENENYVSEEDDFMYANELEEHEVDA
jgi:hypothetical protein